MRFTPAAFIARVQDTAREFMDEPGLALKGRISKLHRFVHFWLVVERSFVRSRCPVRASALSYTTLLTLVPMLAVVFSVTSSLLKGQGEAQIERFIAGLVNTMTPPAVITEQGVLPEGFLGPVNPTTPAASVPAAGTNAVSIASLAQDERIVAARQEVAQKINEFIKNTRSGTLGAVGTVVLLITILTLMTRIEETMNDIWGVTRPRSWMERIEHYWFAVSLGPFLVAAGLTLASGPQFTSVRSWVESTPMVGGLVFKFLPLLLLWLAFTGFYKLMPATRVHWGAAAVGGALSATLWFGTNILGSLYVSRVVTNFKIYGSLGLVPVFMIGLYFSWLVLLFGAQVAYTFQNREAYLQERLAENVNQRAREFVALRLMTAVSHRFQFGRLPATASELSVELAVPGRLVQQIMGTLLTARLVVEVNGRDLAYAPARPLADITAHDVLRALRVTAGQELETRPEPVRAEVLGEFARIEAAEQRAASGVTMLDLAHRAAGTELAVADGPAPAIPLKSAAQTPAADGVASVGRADPSSEPPAAPADVPSAVRSEASVPMDPPGGGAGDLASNRGSEPQETTVPASATRTDALPASAPPPQVPTAPTDRRVSQPSEQNFPD